MHNVFQVFSNLTTANTKLANSKLSMDPSFVPHSTKGSIPGLKQSVNRAEFLATVRARVQAGAA
eukprot:5970457-Amphidinium_carterae.1